MLSCCIPSSLLVSSTIIPPTPAPAPSSSCNYCSHSPPTWCLIFMLFDFLLLSIFYRTSILRSEIRFHGVDFPGSVAETASCYLLFEVSLHFLFHLASSLIVYVLRWLALCEWFPSFCNFDFRLWFFLLVEEELVSLSWKYMVIGDGNNRTYWIPLWLLCLLQLIG